MRKLIAAVVGLGLAASLATGAMAQKPGPTKKDGYRSVAARKNFIRRQTPRQGDFSRVLTRIGASHSDRTAIREFMQRRQSLKQEYLRDIRDDLAVLRNRNASNADYTRAARNIEGSRRTFKERLRSAEDSMFSKISDRAKVAIYAGELMGGRGYYGKKSSMARPGAQHPSFRRR